MSNGPATGDADLIWMRPERAARGPRPTFSRDEIARVAIELADAEGLGAVSMRKIAEKLGTAATSLYSYIANKDDLYELMVDAVIGEIRLPRRSGAWRGDLQKLAHNTHTTLSAHRWMVLLGVQPGLGPKTQRYGEFALSALDGLDLDVSTRIDILAALNNYVFGFLHREAAWEQLRERSGLSSRQWSARMRRYMDSTAERHPELASQIATRLELTSEASFDFGLECLLDGIAALVARSANGTGRSRRVRSSSDREG
jgi:AcrR family transcriptional regulator